MSDSLLIERYCKKTYGATIMFTEDTYGNNILLLSDLKKYNNGVSSKEHNAPPLTRRQMCEVWLSKYGNFSEHEAALIEGLEIISNGYDDNFTIN